jgi:DNA-binding YbaB/EbfC family protein
MDLNEMMAQAREIQSRVANAQENLSKVNVKGLAGNGACIVEMTGKYDVLNVIISNEAMKKSAAELSEIVADAIRDAKEKADAIIDKEMQAATNGVNLPF